MLIHLHLPVNGIFIELNNLYLSMARKYLSKNEEVIKVKMGIIFSNLTRIIYLESGKEWHDENWLLRDYYQQQEVVQMFLQAYMKKFTIFHRNFFIQVLQLCNFLRIYSPQLSEKALQYIRQDHHRFTLINYFQLYLFLGRGGYFPF